jgi:hypothetical protein
LISYSKGLKQSLDETVLINSEKDKSLEVRDASIVDLIDKLDQAEARIHAQNKVVKELHERLERGEPKTRTWLETLKKIGALVGTIDMTEDGAGALNCVEPQSFSEPTVSIATQTDSDNKRETENFRSAETQTDACPVDWDKPVSIISSLPAEAQSAIRIIPSTKRLIQGPAYVSVVIDGSSMPVCHHNKSYNRIHVLTFPLTSSKSSLFKRATLVVEKQQIFSAFALFVIRVP